MNYILKENLEMALQFTINQRRIVEKEHGYTGDSIFVARLVESLEALRSNSLSIKYGDN